MHLRGAGPLLTSGTSEDGRGESPGVGDSSALAAPPGALQEGTR